MNDFELNEIVSRALKEDIGYRDITTESLVPPEHQSIGVIYFKQDAVLAGLPVAERTFQLLDPTVVFESLREDGEPIREGDEVARVSGPTRSLLMGERVSLNFLQRMSGIATKTFDLVDRIRHFPVSVVDTRKTTPGLRSLEKYAVRIGGGKNHRFGLYDGVIIKDNHIRAAGGISEAVQSVRKYVPHLVRIEVEVENLDQLREALEVGADVIMLDNMEPDMMREAVKIGNGRALFEASGGITLDTLVEVAKTGVDLISIGALTHSAPAVDISFDILHVKG
ncbi:MAG: carboxylating nicotinate-nucleotide diphosphorylase [Solirubrobacterales bacterium]